MPPREHKVGGGLLGHNSTRGVRGFAAAEERRGSLGRGVENFCRDAPLAHEHEQKNLDGVGPDGRQRQQWKRDRNTLDHTFFFYGVTRWVSGGRGGGGEGAREGASTLVRAVQNKDTVL